MTPSKPTRVRQYDLADRTARFGQAVIAYAKGGALETTLDGKTALWFHEQTPEAIIAAVKKFEQHSFSPATIRDHACRFAKHRFQHEMQAYIEQKIDH